MIPFYRARVLMGASAVFALASCSRMPASTQPTASSAQIIDRLNFGPLSTTQIGWDQPHEGNLFEHLYARRAIQRLA